MQRWRGWWVWSPWPWKTFGRKLLGLAGEAWLMAGVAHAAGTRWLIPLEFAMTATTWNEWHHPGVIMSLGECSVRESVNDGAWFILGFVQVRADAQNPMAPLDPLLQGTGTWEVLGTRKSWEECGVYEYAACRYRRRECCIDWYWLNLFDVLLIIAEMFTVFLEKNSETCRVRGAVAAPGHLPCASDWGDESLRQADSQSLHLVNSHEFTIYSLRLLGVFLWVLCGQLGQETATVSNRSP